MRYEKDDFGMGTSTSASLLERLRAASWAAGQRDLLGPAVAGLRAAIADRLAITSVDRLEVNLNATRFKGGFRVTGTLLARITQPSVVTDAPRSTRMRGSAVVTTRLSSVTMNSPMPVITSTSTTD